MKRFEMLPGIATMRGNVTGAQDIRYQGNKKAYNTANGKQAAINYRPSYIFHERAKDGLKYFSVRLRQTAVLNSKTRMQMALIGAIAAIKAALKASGTLASVKSAYEYIVAHNLTLPEGVDTFNKFVDYYLRDMLRYKRESWSFTQAGISFTINNPFALDNVNALLINQGIWAKFCLILGFGYPNMAVFSIDGLNFFTISPSMSWSAVKSMLDSACPNFKASWNEITIDQADVVQFRGQNVYSSADVQQEGSSLCAVDAYTTIVPEA